MKTLLVVITLGLAGRSQKQASDKDRAKPAPQGAAVAHALPRAAHAALENGLSLSLVESNRLPLVAVTLLVPQAAPASVPAGQEGLAGFVASMMREGVAGLPTAAEFSDAVEDLGASISASSTELGLSVSVTVLKENLEAALGLVAGMVREPSYLSGSPEHAAALERLRERTLTDLRIESRDPEALAGRRLAKNLFGDGPHGRSATEATISGLTLQQVAARQRETVVPAGSILAVSGDVSLDELKAMAERKFGAWTGAPLAAALPTPPAAVPAPPAPSLSVDLIDVPGQQSQILVGAKALARSHPDYEAAYLAVNVLGGPIVGRLEQIIREKNSWAYGARASLDAWKDEGLIEMGTKVQVDKTAAALSVFLDEARRICDEPVAAEELSAAKNLFKGLYLQRFRTVQAVSSRLATNRALGLPDTALTDFPQRLDAVTAERVQAAAKSWLSPAALSVVIAGPAEQVLPQLRALGATVRLLDPDGNEKPLPPAKPGA